MYKTLGQGLVLTSILLLTGCSLPLSGSTGSGSTANSEIDALRNSRPQRSADIDGTIKSVIGNEFTIETIDMSGIEVPELDRTAMQAMSDAERQALITQMQEARANAPKVNIDVTIPVGIPILVGAAGGGAGGQGGGGQGGGGRGGQAAGGASAGGLGASLTQGQTAGATRADGGAGGSSGTQGTIADIKEGYQIQVRLMTGSTLTGDNARAIAEWVSVSPARSTTAGGGAGGFGGGQGGGFGGGRG